MVYNFIKIILLTLLKWATFLNSASTYHSAMDSAEICRFDLLDFFFLELLFFLKLAPEV